MKPILIIGMQLIAFIFFLYLMFFVIYEIDGWYGAPTSFLCFVFCITLTFTTLLTIKSYLPDNNK